MRSRPARRVLHALVGALLLGAGAPRATVAAPPETYDAAAPALTKAFDAAKPDDRLQAYARAAKLRDVRAVALVLGGLDKERARLERIAKSQAEAQTALEGVLNEIDKLNKQPATTGAAIEAFNKKVRKVERRRDEQYNRLRDLAVEAAGAKAVAAAGTAAAGAVLDALPDDVANAQLAQIAAAWTGPKSTADDQVRWVDLLAAVPGHGSGKALRELALAPDKDVRMRTAALGAAAARREAGVVQDAISLLAEPADRWVVAAAAVDVLRRLHAREAIEPLIAMLGRDDLGRLREDAHRALRSLTAQTHGPYQQPWKDWWTDAKAGFTMPPTPADAVSLSAPDKGVTFYGITTFSDRIVFVLDVSGSMLDPARAEGTTGAGAADGRKIDLARKELYAALAMLDDKKTFDCIFFGHRVVRLLGQMTQAAAPVVERARRFAGELEPTGGTNIHDALEAAFRAAGVPVGQAVTGPTNLVADTIFFMTDGTPTAGKLTDPARILESVAEWNRTAHLTIHTVAVGDECDAKFLEQLARDNGGRFVKR
ncbi:MAG: VWA domain-containing protein [Planctomycetia bacterium]|nr:VWA domain-containing protein [Planctomycetia bacterium]